MISHRKTLESRFLVQPALGTAQNLPLATHNQDIKALKAKGLIILLILPVIGKRTSPVVIDKCVFKMKPWHEFFQDNLENLENSKARIWVRFSRVPFLYWTIKSMCMLGLAVGKSIGMDKGTHRAATRNEPSSVARLLIEIDVIDPV
ncbi:hypothetical protein POM88_050890 [Heracleum sosnowskyi]|uniref:DUF4283 domain-containing protein n=1 Tax=Heracleum sosnowskyi TaxID=360622 RepID=A0AAD8M2V6_9APIA|nr:hypothetical protein POM88_050890 [Heracleum sosnowskyi]